MSVDHDTLTEAEPAPAPLVLSPPERRRLLRRRRTPRPPRPRVRKARLLFVLCAFGLLAVISTLFGALTSIASDLPQFENRIQFSHNVDSYMYDVNGRPIGPLAPASTPAIDSWNQISPNVRNAIVSVEDRGFWGESGISVRGLLRAGLSDLTGGQIQGGSTIPEEFIKNVRQEENHRTVAEKLVEAGMAFQLSHHWKHKKILTEYLNTIYFGNGALGVEAAARVYFGWNHGYNPADPTQESRNACGDPDPQNPQRRECASMLTPAEAALLAAMVANPSEFNPAGTRQERTLAKERRNDVVLKDMYEQHYLTYSQYVNARNTPLPTPAEIHQPQQQPSAAPYFTSWVEPQVVHALEVEGLSPKQAQYEADYGGLKIRLSIDLNLQNEAQQAVNAELPSGQGLPTASLVAIDNRTGEVRAMVSGSGDYEQSPFNLATMGLRQPGSAFKPFTLAAALSSGRYGMYSEFDSKQVTLPFVKKGNNAFYAANGTGRFPVHNFGNEYLGTIPLTTATAVSDNSVFSQLGLQLGTADVKRYAELLGVRTPISTNPSMILGGLSTGVSALDMAHAYSTIADGGVKIFNPILGDSGKGPVGIDSISHCTPCRTHDITNKATLVPNRVLSAPVAATIADLLHGPVDDSYGTGTAAAIPGVDVAGKTGTTSNYVDAWFVGFTPQLTVAVWVGYPDSGKPMTTQFGGKPVEGGTYPAIIWHNFTANALQILGEEVAHKNLSTSTLTTPLTTNTYTQADTGTTTATTPTTSTSSTTTTGSTTQNGALSNQAATQQTQATSNAGGSVTNSTGSGTSGTGSPVYSAPPSQSATTPSAPAPPAPSTSSTTGANGGSGL